jgi:hypothetical protein
MVGPAETEKDPGMSQELIYTSAPRGLRPGSEGFCTVACTAGLTDGLTRTLETLSDYRSGDGGNPVAWSHLRISEGIRELSVLSRKSFASDHTGRHSFFAHHVVLLGAEERPAGGPAWVLRQKPVTGDRPRLLMERWDGKVGYLPEGPTPPAGDRPRGKCLAWERAGFDPGWAGVLAESFLAGSNRLAYLIFRPGLDLLPLLEDAIALVPESRRWSVTFSTYFTGLPPNIPCAWRGVLAGSPEAHQAKGLKDALVLDLDDLGRAVGKELVYLSRGEVPSERVEERPSAGRVRRPEAARVAEPRPGARPIPEAVSAIPAAAPRTAVSLHPDRRVISNPVRVIGLIAAVCLAGFGMLAWFATRDNDSIGEAEAKAKARTKTAVRIEPGRTRVIHPRSDDADMDRAVTSGVNEAEPVLAKGPARPDAGAVDIRDPLTAKPPPLAPPAKPEIRFVNVALPAAAVRDQGHDGDVRIFDLNLPAADHYALRLRGTDDPELVNLHLVAAMNEASALVVSRNPLKGSNSASETGGRGAEQRELARFWVQDGKLRFQWSTSPMPLVLMEHSRSLRDCLLEVRAGDHATLNILLRNRLDLNTPLLVEKGVLMLGWGREVDLPSPRLVILACEVRIKDEWREVPADADRNHRALWILDEAKPDGEIRRVVLRVRLADDRSALHAELSPAVSWMDGEMARSKKESGQLQSRLQTLAKQMRELDHSLA